MSLMKIAVAAAAFVPSPAPRARAAAPTSQRTTIHRCSLPTDSLFSAALADTGLETTGSAPTEPPPFDVLDLALISPLVLPLVLWWAVGSGTTAVGASLDKGRAVRDLKRAEAKVDRLQVMECAPCHLHLI